MSSVGSCPVHRIHLVPQCLDGGLGKEAGAAVSCAAPYDIGRLSVVPFGDFGHDTVTLRSIGQIRTDVVESLPVGFSRRTLQEN